MNYEEALDSIFETYMEKKQAVKGLKYSEYKNPQIFRRLIEKLNLVPEAEKVIKVTGSKGKGTTSKTLSHILESQGKKVGLVLSPEEFSHNDRIQVNNQVISRELFAKRYTDIHPFLQEEEKYFSELDYFSPYGLFLLIALSIFKAEELDFIIIECGRGVKYDDSNLLKGKLGIITSIFLEHTDYFGSSLNDVFNDKIFISKTSEVVLIDKSISSFDLPKNTKIAPMISLENKVTFPIAYLASYSLAYNSACFLLKKNLKVNPIISSNSYAEFTLDDKKIYLDAIINVSGFDNNWFSDKQDAFFFVSWPDDKDVLSMVKYIESLNVSFEFVSLTGTRGYLDYEAVKDLNCTKSKFHFNDFSQSDHFINNSYKKIVFLGTQSFIRFVKYNLSKFN